MAPHIDPSPYLNDPDSEISMSVAKVAGLAIKDIEGWVNGFGTMTLHRVVFSDDTAMFLEGGHDAVYLSPYPGGAQFAVNLDDLYDFGEEVEE